jgi:hypothetical protein
VSAPVSREPTPLSRAPGIRNKIRFKINLETVSAAKLKISARLLAPAKTFIGTQGETEWPPIGTRPSNGN